VTAAVLGAGWLVLADPVGFGVNRLTAAIRAALMLAIVAGAVLRPTSWLAAPAPAPAWPRPRGEPEAEASRGPAVEAGVQPAVHRAVHPVAEPAAPARTGRDQRDRRPARLAAQRPFL
jgi:hypothetical protein